MSQKAGFMNILQSSKIRDFATLYLRMGNRKDFFIAALNLVTAAICRTRSNSGGATARREEN